MNKVIIVTIAGGSGSGKTTLANKLLEIFKYENITRIKLDDYYKRRDELTYLERSKINYDHPDSLDFDFFYNQIKSLSTGNKIEKPVYDFKVHNRSDKIETILPADIIILEGILVLQDERIRDLSDIKIYVDTDADIRFIRRLKRDVRERGRTLESVIDQYLKTVRPMHELYVENTKKYADIIVSSEKDYTSSLNIIESKIREILKS